MVPKQSKIILWLGLLLPMCPFIAQAQTLVNPSDYSGSSSTSGGGIQAGKSWGNRGGFQINWDITQNGSNYNYIYNISNASGGSLSQSLSTFILQLGSSVTSQNFSQAVSNPNQTILSGPQTYNSSTSPNLPHIPGNIYGVGFSLSDSTAQLSFSSNLAPVWGSFYADAGTNTGQSSYAYNTGFGTNPIQGTTDFSNWAPSPGATLPEPHTWLLLLSLLGAAAFAKRYKALRILKKNK